MFHERIVSLQRTVDGLKQDCAAKELEYRKRMEKQETVSERLIKAETKRGDAAEREAGDARRLVEGEQRVNGELRKKIGVMEVERGDVEEEGKKRVVDAQRLKDGQMLVLKEMVVELERVNGELVERGKTLRQRYGTSDLVGTFFRFMWCSRVLMRVDCRWMKKKISPSGC